MVLKGNIGYYEKVVAGNKVAAMLPISYGKLCDDVLYLEQ